MDAFKAIALGAVGVGRAIMGSLGVEGAAGVTKTIRSMTAELAGAMASTCSPDIYHLDPGIIWHK
jgi:isopentenyl diphosphate isomerase/L-lactate dehydrogenase-like FMN-dependent dehydrogenase